MHNAKFMAILLSQLIIRATPEVVNKRTRQGRVPLLRSPARTETGACLYPASMGAKIARPAQRQTAPAHDSETD